MEDRRGKLLPSPMPSSGVDRPDEETVPVSDGEDIVASAREAEEMADDYAAKQNEQGGRGSPRASE